MYVRFLRYKNLLFGLVFSALNQKKYTKCILSYTFFKKLCNLLFIEFISNTVFCFHLIPLELNYRMHLLCEPYLSYRLVGLALNMV